MKTRLIFSISLILILTNALYGKNPCLLFDESEIALLREKIKTAEFAKLWNQTIFRARSYCDPNSSRYVDPEKLWIKIGRIDSTIITHRVSRRLDDCVRTLAFAYKLTGEKTLGRHGVNILLKIARDYPVTYQPMSKGFAGGRGGVMFGLALGYDLLADLMDEDQRRIIHKTAVGYLEDFVAEAQNDKTWWYKYHNFNGVCAGGAGCLAIVLRDVYPDKAPFWIDQSIQVINRWLSHGFDEKGAYLEGVAYSLYGLSNTLLFADALLRNDGPNLFKHPHLRRVPHFYAMSLLPGENVCDARNDSIYTKLNQIPLCLSDAQQSGLAKWLWLKCGKKDLLLQLLWDNDVAPLSPSAAGEPLAEHFPDRGLCIWRTGWKKNDIMFSIEAGPFYKITHNQGDKGHFSLYGLGYRWAADPGYGNDPNVSSRGQTVAHNCVLIDGVGQAPSGAGAGTNGKILKYENNNSYGYALADFTDAYNSNNKHQRGAGAERARRHAFFLRPSDNVPAYAIVLDDIQKDSNEHEYTWQMLTWNNMEITIDNSEVTIAPSDKSTSEGVRMKVIMHAREPVTFGVGTYDPNDNIRPSSLTRLRATAKAVNPGFAAILLPLKADSKEPNVSFVKIPKGINIEVVWDNRKDVVTWSKDECSVSISKK